MLCCFLTRRTDAVFVHWPFASTVSISWLCLSTVEAYKYRPMQANVLQLPTSLTCNTGQLKDKRANEKQSDISDNHNCLGDNIAVAIAAFIWDSATSSVGSCPVPCQISPWLATPCVNRSQAKQSRAGGSPWMTKRNKRPQTLHAFTRTVESNVRKCLVFSSYWLVLNTQILWHLWTNPPVAWIQA